MFKKLFDKDLIDYNTACPICGKQQTIKVCLVSPEAYMNDTFCRMLFPA